MRQTHVARRSAVRPISLDIFIDHEPAAKNHIQLYDDLGQRAVFVGTRWTIGDAGDRLLLRDVGECCDHLRWDMPEPDNPKRDYRA